MDGAEGVIESPSTSNFESKLPVTEDEEVESGSVVFLVLKDMLKTEKVKMDKNINQIRE
jgi:hypothetical protein